MSPDFFERCKETLGKKWSYVTQKLLNNPGYNAVLDESLRNTIQRSVTSKTKSYRYVLPTQLVAKVIDPQLDARCIQASRGKTGDFDARSVATKVIIPFDRRNHNVLGGAPEPYVNNPLRVPEVSTDYRAQQKDKKGWDDLVFILQEVETKKDIAFTEAVFEQVLVEIYRQLSSVQITYPVPKRISLKRTQELINQYLSVPSGGERVLTVVSALMQVVGVRLGLFSEVQRGSITAADRPSGMVTDIKCVDQKGNIVLAVEVKDRELVLNHIVDKLPDIRSKKVTEILYIAQKGIRKENGTKIDKLIASEFAGGHNIYVFEDVLSFSSSILALLGEEGRREFLETVGKHLDQYGAALQHRQTWANLLFQV